LARRLAPALVALALVASGCGSGGVSAGATVSIYVAAPLCKGAQQRLTQEANTAPDLHIRAICLPPVESKGRIDIATVGANARRATEDSTAIAYIEGPSQRSGKFSRPIVEAADIGWTQAGSGATAISHVLGALDAGSPRVSVRKALH
jgi:hypothetical protein